MLKLKASENLNSQIREQLTMFIIDSGLQPGDQIPSEPQLVKTLGVSRNALREALRGLEALGVIEARHGKGRFLRHFDFELLVDSLAFSLLCQRTSVLELLEVRCALELEFLTTAIRTVTREDIRRLRHIVDVMQSKTKGGETHIMEEEQFHRTLFRRVENDLLQKLFLLFWEMLRKVSYKGAVPPPQVDNIVNYHMAIVDAVDAKNIESARRLLREHFQDLQHRVSDMTLPVKPRA